MNATVVKAWFDTTNAYLALAVEEGGEQGRVEYIGSVPLTALKDLSTADQEAAMTAAVLAVRVATQNPVTEINSVSGQPIEGSVVNVPGLTPGGTVDLV